MGIEDIRKLKEQAKLPKEEKAYRIPRKSAKKIAQEKDPQVKTDAADLERWFQARDKEAIGFCLHCGGKTCKGNPKYYKFSIAHLLPKRFFKSVKTHPLNWLELCYFGSSCH